MRSEIEYSMRKLFCEIFGCVHPIDYETALIITIRKKIEFKIKSCDENSILQNPWHWKVNRHHHHLHSTYIARRHLFDERAYDLFMF